MRPARTWKSTMVTVLSRITPEIRECGAEVALTSQSGTATVSTLNWMVMTPSSAVSVRYGPSRSAAQRGRMGAGEGFTGGSGTRSRAEAAKATALPTTMSRYAGAVPTWTAHPAPRAPREMPTLVTARR